MDDLALHVQSLAWIRFQTSALVIAPIQHSCTRCCRDLGMKHLKRYAHHLTDGTCLELVCAGNARCHVATRNEHGINDLVVADLALIAFELLSDWFCCICCCWCCWGWFLLRVFFLEPIDELMEPRPWILQIHDPSTIVLLTRKQFVEEHPLMTSHLEDTPVRLLQILVEIRECARF